MVLVAINISVAKRIKDRINDVMHRINKIEINTSIEYVFISPINSAPITIQTIKPLSVQKNIDA